MFGKRALPSPHTPSTVAASPAMAPTAPGRNAQTAGYRVALSDRLYSIEDAIGAHHHAGAAAKSLGAFLELLRKIRPLIIQG